ncbi:MAG: hypothetical protein MUF84_06285 [Anaerolineae bacterium]|jgi:hypothetical protein|nr:hypothetical protein [Anaerolineae bacterium]
MRKLLLVVPVLLALVGLAIVGSARGNGLPEVGFQSASAGASEDAGQIDLVVTLSASSTLTVAVDYATVEGTALAGQDFVAVSGTLVFIPGTTQETVSVPLLNDTLPEQDKSFTVILTSTQGAVLGLYPSVTVTLTDDDDPYRVFLPLVIVPMPAPVLYPIDNSDGDTSYLVTWSDVYMAEFYELQEDDTPAFSTPVESYFGYEAFWYATGKRAGTHFYRVRVNGTMAQSGWSNIQQVTVPTQMSSVYVQNDTGGTLCYEVYGTGVGQKCFASGLHFYGNFAAGTYTWHASAGCGSASGSLDYPVGGYIHQFWCGTTQGALVPFEDASGPASRLMAIGSSR